MTNAELALLSLIAEHPRHGYEIEQVIEERGMRAWTEVAFSSIYFVLTRLVKQGFAVSSMHPAAGRGPNRKVYTATSAGHAALREGIRDALTSPEPGGQRFLLGLSCLPVLSHGEALAALRTREKLLADKLQELSAHPVVTGNEAPPHVRAMFDYSLSLLLTERSWLRTYIDQLQKE